MTPEIAIKRGKATTRYYTKEEFKKIKKRFYAMKWCLTEICDTDCEDCEFSVPYEGCKILNHFNPTKNKIKEKGGKTC